MTLFLFVWAVPALGQSRFVAKVNYLDINDGNVGVWTTILDQHGQVPETVDFHQISLSFGGANVFDDTLEVSSFSQSEIGTDYVLIIPGYQGFGEDLVIASAQGAGWFQDQYVREAFDTSLVLLYGDGVRPHDGNARDLAVEMIEAPEDMMRARRPYMLNSIQSAISHLQEVSSPGRRRVILLVGTGSDVEIQVTGIEDELERVYRHAYSEELDAALMEDIEQVQAQQRARRRGDTHAQAHFVSARNADQALLQQYVDQLESLDTRVYALGYNEHRPEYLEVLRVLSRKTGGTFRRVQNIGLFAGPSGQGTGGAFQWLGEELSEELILYPSAFEFETNKEYEITIEFTFPYEDRIDPILAYSCWLPEPRNDCFSPSIAMAETQGNTSNKTLIKVVVFVAVVLVIVFLMVLGLIYMVKRLNRKSAHQKQIRHLKEVIALGRQHCRTCYRLMDANWPQCLFCASNMAPMEEKNQAMLDGELAEQELAEIEGRALPQVEQAPDPGGPVPVPIPGGPEGAEFSQQAPSHHMVVDAPVGYGQQAPSYYAAGGQAPGNVPQVAMPQQKASGGDENKTVALSPGMGECPICKRPVPEEWSECLYCKAGV